MAKDVLNNGGRERMTAIEREAVVRFYEQQAKGVGGRFAEAARRLNLESAPQNWNRYTYCLNDPVNLFDPSGLTWLTKDNQNYIWIDDDEYKNNQEQYADYSVANGSITTYQGSADCPQCQGLTKGDLVQLNENGQIVKLDPNEAVNVYAGAEVQTYTSSSLGNTCTTRTLSSGIRSEWFGR